MSYRKKTFRYYLFIMEIVLTFNLYFLYLVPGIEKGYLYYIDFLFGIGFLVFFLLDYRCYLKKKRRIGELLASEDLIGQQLKELEEQEVYDHDMLVLKVQLQEKFDESCELQDYVAKWCHEMKIPLATGMLLNESINEPELKGELKEQLERMNRSLNVLLLGCKLQSPLFDLQIRQTWLKECIQTSIKNNQFFLIQKKFEIEMKEEDYLVYTDPTWIVYVLDQLISNAVKYAANSPKLQIWMENDAEGTYLFIKDFGEGIQASDIGRIFEKGYTGKNYHNGKYKSTGMGLYLAMEAIKRLGHDIAVDSRFGKYTQFVISFPK